MIFRTLLFDLDGTLTDSGPGILKAVQNALEAVGIVENDLSKLIKFVGPPLRDSFMQYYGLSKGKSEQAVSAFRNYYSEKGIWENSVYDGIPELLERLLSEGKTLLVATSKLEESAEKVLNHFHLRKYFKNVTGSLPDGTRSKKSEVIRSALSLTQNNSQETAIIGDRFYDILGAKDNGIISIGVLYGYGSKEELVSAGADYVAETINDLSNILL